MTTSNPTPPANLEDALARVDHRLLGLATALQSRDARALEREAAELQRALAGAMRLFTLAARRGGVPPALRQQLASLGGKVAAQRNSLARATAALDRAIDLLLGDSDADPTPMSAWPTTTR